MGVGVVMSPQVVGLEVGEPFRIWVRFDDGVTGNVDLSDSAALGGIFAQWSDEGFWRSAHIVADSDAMAWGDGAEIDVCPHSLYLDVTSHTFEDLQAETTQLLWLLQIVLNTQLPNVPISQSDRDPSFELTSVS